MSAIDDRALRGRCKACRATGQRLGESCANCGAAGPKLVDLETAQEALLAFLLWNIDRGLLGMEPKPLSVLAETYELEPEPWGADRVSARRYDIEYRFPGADWEIATQRATIRFRGQATRLAEHIHRMGRMMKTPVGLEVRVVEVTRAVVFELGPGVGRGGGAETPEAEAGREAPGAGAEEAGR